MSGPWSLERLAAVSGEPEDRLGRYADAGLLHRQDDDELEPGSLHRLRLIQFAPVQGRNRREVGRCSRRSRRFA